MAGSAASTSRSEAWLAPSWFGSPGPPTATESPLRRTSSTASIDRREPRSSTVTVTAPAGST